MASNQAAAPVSSDTAVSLKVNIHHAKDIPMPYQGARARELLRDPMSVFAVSKVRLDADGHVTDVLWGVIDKKSNHWVSPAALASVAEVVEAIHNGDQVLALFPTNEGRLPEREFEVVEFDDGSETIELDAANAPAPEIRDMVQLET
jgi:hypothetical protein